MRTHKNCVKSPYIRQRMEFGAKCLEKTVEPLLFEQTMREKFFSKYFDTFTLLLEENDKDC
jgi:hypothetical protein